MDSSDPLSPLGDVAPTESFRALADATQYYLDMLYACDADMVDRIFHAHAQLCTIENGVAVFRSVEEYKGVLRARVAPRSRGAPRADEPITFDVATPSQAFIKVKVRINDMVFIDYLTLFRFAEGWRIVSKTYQRLA